MQNTHDDSQHDAVKQNDAQMRDANGLDTDLDEVVHNDEANNPATNRFRANIYRDEH